MNASDLEELRTRIQEESEQLKRDIGRLQEEVKPIAPDRAIGRLTRMEAINAQKISEANLRKAKARLQRLEQTIPRLDDEDYGICERCDRDIPVKRLLLMPESRFCVRCLDR